MSFWSGKPVLAVGAFSVNTCLLILSILPFRAGTMPTLASQHGWKDDMDIRAQVFAHTDVTVQISAPNSTQYVDRLPLLLQR